MKRRILALVLAVIMTVSVLSVTAGAAGKTSLFPDVTTADWFYYAVDYVNSNGLMTGTGKGFAPNDATTRAQIWAILARLDGNNYDRNTGDWYANYQLWAIRNSISDGSEPNGKITREQLAAMLYRYAIRKSFVGTGTWADLSVFPDHAKVSRYAAEAMQWAVGSGLVQGMDGKLNPQGTATSAQVATILWRMCEKWALLQEEDLSGILGALQSIYQHAHDYTYTSNRNFTHTGVCGCGKSVTEACSYVESMATLDADGVNEKKYTCSVCGDSYTVAFNDDGTEVLPVARVGGETYSELSKAIEAAQAGDTVALMADVIAEADNGPGTNGVNYAGVTLNGGILDGAAHSISIKDKEDAAVILTHGGKLQNTVISQKVGRGIFIDKPTTDVVLDNVTIDGPTYTLNTGNPATDILVKLTVSNSTLNGWTSFDNISSASFDNCSFGKGTTNYNTCRPYCTTIFTNCTFENGYKLSLCSLNPGASITLINCTCNGVILTAENIIDFIKIDVSWNESDGYAYATADTVSSYVTFGD